MEANNRKLYTKIIEQTYRQYTIPVYQRLYSWQKQQCNQLYDDIIDSIKKGKNHYLGSLVYSEKTEDNFSFCPIIDGQQRLTTVILLLKALYDIAGDDENDRRIKNRIYNSLYNDNCEERYKLKLKSVDSDNQELEKILMGNLSDLDQTSNVAINYNNFKDRIYKSLNQDNLSIGDLFEGITNLEIVEIILDGDDDPQLIFESINSTGMNLETSDLIRNYLLMGIRDPGKQKEYHSKYWIKLQNDIGKNNIEKFFYDFLVMKDTRYIEEKKVYDNFKMYYRKVNNQENVFEDIIKFGEYYKLIVCNNSKLYGKKSNEICSIFGLLKHSTIYPLLLKICDEYRDVQLLYKEGSNTNREVLEQKEKELNKILSLFGNYALRRAIAEIPSSSLRRFYAGLYNRVFVINKENKNVYYKALESYLCTLKTNDRMPTDKTFKDSLIYNNIYKKPKILRYFFDFIENDNNEPVDMSDMTIEHILPETLSNQWKKELGEDRYQEIYDKYVHTLGNLSITGYNSVYSNRSYSEKKKIFKELFDENKVKIKTLNKELLDENIIRWNEDEIENRAKRLASLIVEKYPYPRNIDTSLQFEKYYEFYIDDEDDDGGEYVDNPDYKLYGFKFDGVKYRANYFKDVYIEIVKILYSLNPSILDEYAKQNYTFEKNGTRILFSKERIHQYQAEVAPDLYIEKGYSRHNLFKLIRWLFKEYQLDIENMCILFTDKE